MLIFRPTRDPQNSKDKSQTSFKSRFEKNQTNDISMTFDKPLEASSSRAHALAEVGQSTLKSGNFDSKFETIREEEPAGNHQSPTVRGQDLNRDLDVPEHGPEDDMQFDNETEENPD